MAHHLAQVNLALPREPLESELLADFMAQLDPVNDRADTAPGFVWRLQSDAGDATGIRGFDDDRLIINMSTWASLDALREFVYRDPLHLQVMRARRKWFEKLELVLVLWWVPAGHRPTVGEAEERMAHLQDHGPTPHAFTFRRHFPPAGEGEAETAVDDDRDLCPA